MKPILFYDTETTGLPIWAKPSEDPAQPYITQIAAELCDEETGETLQAINFLIEPEGWTIPEDIQKLTGITQEKAERFGIKIGCVLPHFFYLWQKSEIRVAHNEPFDMRMIRIAMMRDPAFQKHADKWKESPAFCTQSNSTNILKLPPTERMLAAGRNTSKSPNLAEAYRHFTGKELDGAHNAAVDIMGCKAVYFGIKNHARKAA